MYIADSEKAVVQHDRLMGIVSTDYPSSPSPSGRGAGGEGSHVKDRVPTSQTRAVPPAEWERRPVHEIMLPSTSDNTIAPDTDVLDAWNRMSRTEHLQLQVEAANRADRTVGFHRR
jgi:hypothetical protein